MCLQGQGRGRARALREERHAAGLRAPGHLEELQAQEDGEVRRCGDAADGLGRDRKLVVAHGAADVAEHQGLAVQRAQPGLRGQADRGLQRLLVAGRHRRGQRHHRGLRRGRRAAPALAAALAEALALGRLVHRQEGREEAVRQLHGARDLALVLQAPEQGLVVALGDAGAQDVAEVPEHGHEGQPLLVDELLPGLGVVALLAELRLEGHGLREAQPPARLALVEAAGQPGLLELLGARGVALAEDLHDQLLGLVDVAHADQALHAEHRAVPGRLAGLLLGFAALGAALGAALAVALAAARVRPGGAQAVALDPEAAGLLHEPDGVAVVPEPELHSAAVLLAPLPWWPDLDAALQPLVQVPVGVEGEVLAAVQALHQALHLVDNVVGLHGRGDARDDHRAVLQGHVVAFLCSHSAAAACRGPLVDHGTSGARCAEGVV
mmetsp:Transcript_8007/g.24920  ORF Transcript_8007/g.24920 Transcript_8007/m.24920 type:complete len:438 (-) Transcript_8007:750-2063(-)